MKKLLGALVAFGIFGVFSQGAMAQNSSDSFDVTVTVDAGCDLASGAIPNIAHTDYNPFAVVPNDQFSAFSITCTPDTGYAVELTYGANPTGSGPTTQRHMVQGAYSLAYGLFADAAHATPWGLSADSIDQTGTTGSGAGAKTVNFTIFSRITPSQFVAPGAYSDTVVANITAP